MKKQNNLTIKDIAERVGTSTISVHRAIHGKEGISDALRQRILEEIEKSQYSINEAASLLRREEAEVVILLPKAENEDRFFFRDFWTTIRELESYYRRFKIKFRYEESPYGLKGMREALKRLFDKTDASLFGLITDCEDEESSEWIERFISRGTRVVTVSNSSVLQPNWWNIMSSHDAMGKLAANMMRFGVGDRVGKILCMRGNDEISSHKVYADAFAEQINCMLPECEVINISGFEIQEVRARAQQVLNDPQLVGVMTCNARMTYAICSLMQECGNNPVPFMVGTDVFEELIPYFENETLKASIYQYPKEQIKRAVDILYRELSETGIQQEKVLPGFIEMPIGVVMKENYRFYI